MGVRAGPFATAWPDRFSTRALLSPGIDSPSSTAALLRGVKILHRAGSDNDGPCDTSTRSSGERCMKHLVVI